jgi:hypothetical protein
MLVYIAIFTTLHTFKDLPFEIYLKFFSLLRQFNPQTFGRFCWTKLRGVFLQYLMLCLGITTFLAVVSWTNSFLMINICILGYITF